MRQLNRNKESLSAATRLLLIKSLILPYFDYCSLVYDDITDELNNKLERVLNACIRFVFNLPKSEHITQYRIKCGLLNVAARRQYFMGNLLYSIFKNMNPMYLHDFFEFRNNITTASSRLRERNSVLIIPQHRTCKMQRSFIIRGARLWNELPPMIRDATNQFIFKKLLFDFLFKTNDKLFNITYW